jgi:hypothetical protein
MVRVCWLWTVVSGRVLVPGCGRKTHRRSQRGAGSGGRCGGRGGQWFRRPLRGLGTGLLRRHRRYLEATAVVVITMFVVVVVSTVFRMIGTYRSSCGSIVGSRRRRSSSTTSVAVVIRVGQEHRKENDGNDQQRGNQSRPVGNIAFVPSSMGPIRSGRHTSLLIVVVIV